jgi:two-component system sensor histidine kinase KdpD
MAQPAQDPRPAFAWHGYALTGGLVALATAVGALGRRHVDSRDLVMLYLLVVVIAAARFGRGPSFLAATLSVLAFDFFFIPPTFTFLVSEKRYVLTFAMMLVVGLLTSGLTLRIRRQEHLARAGEDRTRTLYGLSRDLTSAVDAREAALVTTRHAAAVCQGAAAIFTSDAAGQLVPLAESGALPLDQPGREAIAWAFAHARGAGRGTETAADARVVAVPLLSGGQAFGVLVFSATDVALGMEQRNFLDAFARLAALALARARLAKQAEGAAIRATAEEMRSTLLSAVSHDLRTPLAVITGAATTLRDAGPVDGPQRAELLETICEEADRLERLVRNLLDLTRVQSGALPIKREWVPLEEIVGSALTRLERQLAGRPLRTDLPADLPLLVPVDAVLLEQVFVNLLENAAKYTPPGGAIDISARVDGQAVIIEVADRGPGIAAGEETRIFERFFRSRHGRVSGAGLGLAICRGVVAAHGGTITAANRQGSGAVFRVTLPREGDPPAAPNLDAAPPGPEAPPS